MSTIDDVLSGRAKWCVVTGECLSIMRKIPASTIHAVITDPPYSSGGMVRGDRNVSTSAKYQHGDTPVKLRDFTGDTRDQRSWEYWCALWMGAARECTVSGGYLATFSDWRMLPTATDAIQAGGWVWRGIVPWNKGNAIPQPNSFRAQCEYLVWGTSGPRDIDYAGGVYAAGLFEHVTPKDRVHVTEKPVGVMVDAMQLVPPEGLVLDPFCGSGTTGVACMQTGRRFIGIEIDEGYATIARRRIAEAANHLFAGGVA